MLLYDAYILNFGVVVTFWPLPSYATVIFKSLHPHPHNKKTKTNRTAPAAVVQELALISAELYILIIRNET